MLTPPTNMTNTTIDRLFERTHVTLSLAPILHFLLFAFFVCTAGLVTGEWPRYGHASLNGMILLELVGFSVVLFAPVALLAPALALAFVPLRKYFQGGASRF